VIKLESGNLTEIKQNKFGYYEIPIFIFLFFEFLIKTSDSSMDPMDMMSYLVTYKFGFGSRMLIGSVFSLFTDQITKHLIYITSVTLFLILILLISLLLGGILRKSQPELRQTTTVFILLFLASPYSVTYLLGVNAPQLDIYWLILTLLSLVFLKRPVLCWLIPLMCAVAILTEEAYLFNYMPALAIPMLYEVYKSKYSKKSISIFCSSCLVLIISFWATRFFTANIPFDNAVDYTNYLSKKADFYPNELWVYGLFFSDFQENIKFIKNVTWPIISTFALPLGIFFVSVSMPLIIIFVSTWKKCIRYAGNKFLKFIFILCLAAPLAFIPAAVIGNDWDRWWAAMINTQFILIFYLIYSKEKVLIDFIKRIGDFFGKHLLLLLLILLLSVSLSNTKAVSNTFYFAHNVEAANTSIVNFLKERGLQNFLN